MNGKIIGGIAVAIAIAIGIGVAVSMMDDSVIPVTQEESAGMEDTTITETTSEEGKNVSLSLSDTIRAASP